MNNFFIIATFGYACMAVVAILDKFILTKELKVSAYAFYSTFFFLGAFFLLPFAEAISWQAFIVALISGLGFGFATWTMFIGLRYAEATHCIPFIGASTAVFVYGLSSLFFGEVLSVQQSIGVLILILASFMFSHEKAHSHRGVHPSFAWGLLSGFLFALSHVTAKIFYGEYSFITGLVWTKGLVGLVAIFIIIFSISARREVFGKKHHDAVESKKEVSGKGNMFWVVLADKVVAIAGTLAVQYAIAIGSVAVVSGLVGLQYALILIFAFVSTKIFPRYFSEYFTKKEIAVEVTAICLVVIGVFFLI
jgi:drug/metabolite transporter (DMT)-like permease